jgi:hypothetical protein
MKGERRTLRRRERGRIRRVITKKKPAPTRDRPANTLWHSTRFLRSRYLRSRRKSPAFSRGLIGRGTLLKRSNHPGGFSKKRYAGLHTRWSSSACFAQAAHCLSSINKLGTSLSISTVSAACIMRQNAATRPLRPRPLPANDGKEPHSNTSLLLKVCELC